MPYLGHLDNLTVTGYIEGWARDLDAPTKVVHVAILSGDDEVAWGAAHRYRHDLMESRCGIGWNAFRLACNLTVKDLIGRPMVLIERDTRQMLADVGAITYVEDPERPAPSLAGLIAEDPTTLGHIWQLQGCADLFQSFLRRHGVERFVCMAYLYVLGRPADFGGLKQYTRSIRQMTLSPYGLLEALSHSDEFSNANRQLCAPNSNQFPFL